MVKDNKLVVIALSIICFILLYATIAFYVMEEGEKSKKNVLQARLNEMIIVKQDLETKLKDAEMVTVELKTRLSSQENTIASMTQHLEELKAENNRNIITIRDRDDEIRSVKAKLEDEKTEKDSILKKLEKMNEDYLAAKFQLEGLLKTREEMDRKAKELLEKEGVSLGTIVVN